jgi:restriction system protein
MDFTPLFKPLFTMLWCLLPLLVLATLLKSTWFKGVVGEFMVNLAAKWLLDAKTYHLIKNVTLPTQDGTTQIDHLIVSPYGVFVVETKNMKGWIFGSEKQKSWIQKIYKHKQTFQNPLHQNYKHVKTLEAVLGLRPEQIHSVVVFVGDSTFKTEMPQNVTHGIGYIRYIKSKREVVLSDDEVSTVIEKIGSGRLEPSIRTHISHVNHVKEHVRKKESDTSCPKCGSEMVLRVVKKGEHAGKQFFGCLRFPSCRGIRNVI